MRRYLHIFILSAAWMLFMNFSVFDVGAAGIQERTAGVLNPDNWFDVFKKNIAVPLPTSSNVNIPSPEKTLKDASPKLKEVNAGIREETGIDFSKFIGWFAKVLGTVFQIVINILQAVAGALK